MGGRADQGQVKGLLEESMRRVCAEAGAVLGSSIRTWLPRGRRGDSS